MADTAIVDSMAVDRIMRSPDGPVFQYLMERGTAVQTLAHAQVPVRTGELRGSIVKRFTDDPDGLSVLIGTDKSYALFVHNGTDPHVIVARGGGMLRFFWPKAGKVVYFPSVHHPGTHPEPYLTDPLRAVMG